VSIESAIARIGQIEQLASQLLGGGAAHQASAPSTVAPSFANQLVSAQAQPVAPAAGSLVPAGAKLSWQRVDQGQDLQTDPGGPLLALGDGYVKQIASDPGGFGPDYPVVHFTSGPLAGKDVYYGHTHTALAAGQQFKAGDVISHTGLSGVGNASVGGWAEIGFWPPGSMDAGSQIAPLLHS